MVQPYNPDCPGHCPPNGAKGFQGELLRAAKKLPLAARDMLSLVEQGRPADRDNCKSWGLSVWTEEADALHARSIVPFFRNCCIVRINVGVDDGVLLHTPSNEQPGHYTYWKKFDVKVAEENVSLFIGPESS